jgi:hypothetical protein
MSEDGLERKSKPALLTLSGHRRARYIFRPLKRAFKNLGRLRGLLEPRSGRNDLHQ